MYIKLAVTSNVYYFTNILQILKIITDSVLDLNEDEEDKSKEFS